MNRLLKYFSRRRLKKVREELEYNSEELAKKANIHVILLNYYHTIPVSDPNKDRKSIIQWAENGVGDTWELYGKVQDLRIEETKLMGKLQNDN